jgi:hypothetical protein
VSADFEHLRWFELPAASLAPASPSAVPAPPGGPSVEV